MNKTILVTGATGFLGSNLVKRLLEKNYRVIILKRSFSNTWRIDDVLSQVIFYDVDKHDLTQIFAQIKSLNAIIHTATCYGKNNESISSIFEANTVFPLKLLELASEFKIPAFFNTDTYFNKGNKTYQGLASYSLSKQQFHEWGKYFAQNQKIFFINLQLEHLFGEGDEQSKFTSYIMKSCLENIRQLELTNGEQKRDFIYVDDVVSAYLLLLEKAEQIPDLYQNYEVGSGQSISIREFVEMVHNITQSQTCLKFGVLPYREQEIMDSQANIAPLTELGWFPESDLETVLCRILTN